MNHSEAAERAVIAAALAGSSIVGELVLIVAYNDFLINRHKTVWQHVCRLYRENQPSDLLAIRNEIDRLGNLELIGGDAWLMELADEHVSNASVKGYAEIVRSYSVTRMATRHAKELDAAVTDGQTMDEVVQMSIRHTAALTEAASPTSKDSGNVVAALAEILTNDVPAITYSGYQFLDLFVQMRAGNMIVIGATPGAGKTSLALGIASNVAKIAPVLFDSLEMSTVELTENLTSQLTQIYLDRIMGRVLSPSEMAECRAAVITRSRLRITSAKTVGELHATARAMKVNGGLGLVVVDYIQLMEAVGAENKNAEVSKISRGLKLMAMDLEVPVLVLAQLSREGAKNGSPMLHHLRDSGAIEQDANAVIFLYQDGECDGTDRKIKIAKNRRGKLDDNGRAGFDGGRVSFYDIQQGER